MDPITEYILNEGYLFSDKNISVNLSKFESGESNKLLILGTAGSGKTTIGEMLSKQYKIKWISIDSMWWRLKQKYFKDSDLIDKVIHKKVEKKVYEFVIAALKSNERFIMEGIDLLDIYDKFSTTRPLILKQSMIILGLSSLRAGIRASKRNQEREPEGNFFQSNYWMIRFNVKKTEPKLKMIRNDIGKNPKNEVKEYQVPKEN